MAEEEQERVSPNVRRSLLALATVVHSLTSLELSDSDYG